MLYEAPTKLHIKESSNVLILILMEYALWVHKIMATLLKNCIVLILILMEYALWDGKGYCVGAGHRVLILILMEYALWGTVCNDRTALAAVLILILMEYALWASSEIFKWNNSES